ncbi:hypothetical protein L915_08994 [Phytophthora nicotianae]|uniref:PiggyBac transposable element-derived protein domain-containing protein n=1 Tax=Phytophthora nicotianae TaxID=4792 RepID=W2GVP3_PHYNI|nr:hypothetical protein L915_08994 [Phytophthora nicotianae]
MDEKATITQQLYDRYMCISPEGHPNGKVGLDYFLREVAVLDFYADATTNEEPPQLQASPLPQRHSTRPPGRRSLETTTIFIISPPSTSPSSISASPLSTTSPHVGDDSFKIGDSDHASSPEENNDDDSGASAEVHTDLLHSMLHRMLHIILHSMLHIILQGDEDNEDNLDTLGSELLADKHDNLNAVEPGESADQYGVIESGDEAEKDDVDVGEYDSDHDVVGFCAPKDFVDEVDETEAKIPEEVLFAANFLESFGRADEVLYVGNGEDVVEPNIDDHMMGPYDPVSNKGSYPGLRQGYSGPSAEALRPGDSPIALFFYYLPVVLWQHIAGYSNDYHREMLPLRIDAAYSCYRKKQRPNPDLPRKTRRDIQNELETMNPIMLHELCRFIGLLIARTIAPNREKLTNHRKTTDKLAFQLESRPPSTNRSCMEDKEGGGAPPYLSFDEAVLPSRSSFNKMRAFMKETTCQDAHKPDMKSGPAAVVRNVLEVFGKDARKQGMRLVVINRFYTSVALAIQLLLMGFYCVGTIMTKRLGYCKEVIEKK